MGKVRRTRVAVGLSGGVDSALSACLLKEQGYDVTGVHLVCWEEPGCRAPQDRKDALAVSLQLVIPFEVLDFQKEYRKKVIEYFYAEYEAGRTPNPDVVCNRKIKFGMFLDWALEHGFDFIATGHYARVKLKTQISERKTTAQNSKVVYHLLRGMDEKKDQSYFLYTLTQEQLKHVLFPVGYLTKQEVRMMAKKRELPVAEKPDSTGICFVGEVDVREFLKRRIKEKKGEVVMIKNYKSQISNNKQIQDSKVQKVSNFDIRGLDLRDNYEVIGEHDGVWFYTIGQRHGFLIEQRAKGVGQKAMWRDTVPPLYVVGKDVTRNRLIVGTDDDALRREFYVQDVHWINGIRHKVKGKGQSVDVTVRIRHGGQLLPVKLIFKGLTLQGVKLLEAQRGVAPGQSAVFYRGEECLGGGIIGEERGTLSF